jgi:hypothetical protein
VVHGRSGGRFLMAWVGTAGARNPKIAGPPAREAESQSFLCLHAFVERSEIKALSYVLEMSMTSGRLRNFSGSPSRLTIAQMRSESRSLLISPEAV